MLAVSDRLAQGCVAVGTKEGLDAGVQFCKEILVEVLGEEQGTEAFRYLPALDGLIFFKAQDREGLREWASAWLAARPH